MHNSVILYSCTLVYLKKTRPWKKKQGNTGFFEKTQVFRFFSPTLPHCLYMTHYCPYMSSHWPYLPHHCPYMTPHCPYMTPHCPDMTHYCPYMTPHCPYMTPHCPYMTPYCPYMTPYCPLMTQDLRCDPFLFGGDKRRSRSDFVRFTSGSGAASLPIPRENKWIFYQRISFQ